MDYCHNCTYWTPLPPWQGNCKLYPTDRPQWSEVAMPQDRGCQAFTPKAVPGIYRDGKLIKAL
jgi:hypothetical protein